MATLQEQTDTYTNTNRFNNIVDWLATSGLSILTLFEYYFFNGK